MSSLITLRKHFSFTVFRCVGVLGAGVGAYLEEDLLFDLLASSVDLAEVRAVLLNLVLKNEGVSVQTELLQVPAHNHRILPFYYIS